MQPLVSIIIPTYNRAHLIGETLDSVLAQTYQNWECIVVDDGSADNSDEVIEEYVTNDSRFKYHKRPDSKPKGANGCRNIGLDEAVGDYIIFFDSDDLMTPEHLEVKVRGMKDSGCDYVITKTKFFNSDKDLEKNYRFDMFEITPYNYVSQKINWLTLDICLLAEIAKTLSFNEQLQSGQEYNYFCKLVHKTTNGFYINEVVSLRRHHEQSIRSRLVQNNKVAEDSFTAQWLTYHEIKDIADKSTRGAFTKVFVKMILKNNTFRSQKFLKIQYAFYTEFGPKSLYLSLYFFSHRLFNKGHFWRKKVQRVINS